MRPAFIYVLLDNKGRRIYVGKSIRLTARFCDHRNRKFPDAVAYEVLETCDADDAIWPAREKFWIAHGRALGWPLRNIVDGGNGYGAASHSLETRAKMSASHKGLVHSPETRARMSVTNRRVPWNKGKSLTDETRAKLSVAHKGKTHSLETRAKMSATQYARHRRHK